MITTATIAIAVVQSATPDYTAEHVWGEGDKMHDSDYHKNHQYGWHRDNTTYRSNFLLAFDENSTFELKLRGGVEAISDAIETISLTNDYGLLKRLMDTVTAMPASKKNSRKRLAAN